MVRFIFSLFLLIVMEFISASELAKRKQDFLLVDVREKDAFESWHIPGSKNVDVYEDIWQGNVEVVKEQLQKLPKDKPIVTICNMGATSQHAAGLLEQSGYQTLVLEQGMMGWNKLHVAADVVHNGLVVKQIIRLGKGCLSYLIGDADKRECIIVDASQFVEEYVKLVRATGFQVLGVIDTHVHADHLSGSKQLAEMLKVPYFVSGKDFSQPGVGLDNKKELFAGKVKIEVINTPGHTAGSVCLRVDNTVLLTGDTLFLKGVGRPDLLREKEAITEGARQLFKSLQTIKSLPEGILILPAHTSVVEQMPVAAPLGNLMKENKLLSLQDEKEFVAYLLEHIPHTPPNYEQIKRMNMHGITITGQMGEQLEFGPNRCAAH